MLKLIIMIAILLMSGCSLKPKEVYIKEAKYPFKTIQQPPVQHIRVYKEDVKLYKMYIKQFRDIIAFYNKQIKLYREEK